MTRLVHDLRLGPAYYDAIAPVSSDIQITKAMRLESIAKP